MVTTHGGSSAASASRSHEHPVQPVVATTGKGPSETIMVVVRGRLFRDGIQSVLQSPDRVIIGNCETLDQVASRLDTLSPPDLFVVGGGGSEHLTELFAGIRQLRARMPTAKWLILSPRTDAHLLREALETGADGLLLEDSPAEVLQLLTKLILLGHSFVPAPLARVLSERVVSADPENATDSQAPLRLDSKPGMNGASAIVDQPSHRAHAPSRLRTGMVPTSQGFSDGEPEARRQVDLSDRENEILGCLVSGHSNKIIARKLDIAEATVKVHVKGLLRKMQVSNRTQAAIRALKFPQIPVVPNNPSDGTM